MIAGHYNSICYCYSTYGIILSNYYCTISTRRRIPPPPPPPVASLLLLPAIVVHHPSSAVCFHRKNHRLLLLLAVFVTAHSRCIVRRLAIWLVLSSAVHATTSPLPSSLQPCYSDHCWHSSNPRRPGRSPWGDWTVALRPHQGRKHDTRWRWRRGGELVTLR